MGFNEIFDFAIPFGFNCNSANALKLSNKRYFKLPFDWMAINGSYNPDAYLQMIDDALNNNLDLNMQRDNRPEKTYTLIKYNACLAHEPIDHDIELITKNYNKYFNRLIKILQYGTNEKKSKILIVISTFYDIFNDISIIEKYKSYLEKNFPNNIYYFLSVNLGRNYIEQSNWINLIIKIESYIKVINGVETVTDDYLETFVNYCKDNINIRNTIIN